MKTTPSILAIMAHPGDAAVLCFGTLAKFKQQGARVAWCCVTDGAGGNKLAQNLDRPFLAYVRASAQLGGAASMAAMRSAKPARAPPACIVCMKLMEPVCHVRLQRWKSCGKPPSRSFCSQ